VANDKPDFVSRVARRVARRWDDRCAALKGGGIDRHRQQLRPPELLKVRITAGMVSAAMMHPPRMILRRPILSEPSIRMKDRIRQAIDWTIFSPKASAQHVADVGNRWRACTIGVVSACDASWS